MKVNNGIAGVINTTAVDSDIVASAAAGILSKDPQLKSIADALGGWVERQRTPTSHPNGRRQNRVGGILDRNRWLNPDTAFEKIKLARETVRDDIVSTAADGTEAFALSKVGIFTEDLYEEACWNEWAGNINLDDQLRKAWRTLFTDSTFVIATWWGRQDIAIPGVTENGNKRRKSFTNMLVPTGITFLDSTKVVPVGNLMFGQEQLAYMPHPQEAMRIDRVLFARDNPGATFSGAPGFMRYGSGRGQIVRVPKLRDTETVDAVELDDPLINQLFVGRYEPDHIEAQLLQEDGVDISNLFLFRPDMVFRHCLTRPDYQRFADVRLESLFPLLDLKAQLRQIDRVTLVGGSNFIVLITKGTDALPAEQSEIDALRASAFTLASVPVIVGDHRLKVEIITPKVDLTLDRSKWDTLDDAIFARVWSTFKHDVSRTEDPLKTAMIIAKNLESRRQMMRRTFEREIFDRMRRRNADQLKGRATLVFTPAKITMAFDAAWASFLMDLRASNEISRDTTLGQFDLDQAHEAEMRQREAKTYDKTFQTQDPHGTPNPMNGANPTDPGNFTGPGGAKAAQRAAGRGAKGGGLPNDGSGRGKAAVNPRHKANPDTPQEKAREVTKAVYDMDRGELIDLATDYQIPGRHQMRKTELISEIRAFRLGINTDDLEFHDDEDGSYE